MTGLRSLWLAVRKSVEPELFCLPLRPPQHWGDNFSPLLSPILDLKQSLKLLFKPLEKAQMVFLSTAPPARATKPNYPDQYLPATPPLAGGQPGSMHKHLRHQGVGNQTSAPCAHSAWAMTGPAQHSTNLRGASTVGCPSQSPLNTIYTISGRLTWDFEI